MFNFSKPSIFIGAIVFCLAFSGVGLAAVGGAVYQGGFFKATQEVRGQVLGLSDRIERAADFVIAGNARGSLPVSEENPSPPVMTLDGSGFELEGGCGAILDVDSGKIIFSQNDDTPRPIASITKLVTAMVFLEHNPGWGVIYEVEENDRREGGKIYLFSGEKVTVKDLFYLSLVGSGNTETISLVKSTGLTEEGFVAKMNEKMKEMGMEKTNFCDPIGLNNGNVSTAADIVRFAHVALSTEEIKKASLTEKYEFKTQDGKNKIVYNTDNLLGDFKDGSIRIEGGKTGYNEGAGYCFVGRFVNEKNKGIVSVFLGGESRDSRFEKTKEMVNWVFDNFNWTR